MSMLANNSVIRRGNTNFSLIMEDTRPRYSKRLRSGTRRRYQDDGISDDEIEGKRSFDLDEKLQSDRFNTCLVKRMEGKDFTFEYIQKEGLRAPIVFEKPDGLGIQMPETDFSVNDVKLFVGSRRVIDVMDVTTQKGIEMSMAQWRRYYETPPAQREKLYNVISLEFSHTKLENLVKRPASVDVIDWVDNMWPRHLKERQRDSTNAIIDMQYPKVQKYCLMSVEGCFTDFHVDFGGTSVWYHVLRGGKVFWIIPPTPQNLELYENWVLSGKQGDIFLGDKATECQRIELKQGYTFMIPSGWIHAVYTPVDTLVFGGNFLHSFNIPMQLHINNIEDRTRVPAKFRYPFYYETCWYVLERYLYCLTNTSHLTPEFQKHSLGIGLKREDVLNHRVKEELSSEEEEEKPTPTPAPSKPGVKVHLTPFELDGLWNLLGKLESLPSHKKCVPAGIHNAPALLHDIRTLLQEHANDDPKLAYTGMPIVRWPKRPPWYQPPPPPLLLQRPRLSGLTHPLPLPRPVKPPSSISALRRRRVRCKRCEACLRTECGDCNYCHDMKKFGGPGRLKKTCVLRQCLAPGLPLSAVCAVCGEGNQDPDKTPVTLMECSNCAQITHPDCLKVPSEGVVNSDLPSFWECPKCILEKVSTSESSSSSDDDSVGSTRAVSLAELPPAKRFHRNDVVGNTGGGVRPSHRGQVVLPLSSVPEPRSRRMVLPPSHGLLLQQQLQNRRRAGALEVRLRRRIKMEQDRMSPSKRKASSPHPCSPKLRRQSQDSDGYKGSDRLARGMTGAHPLRGPGRRLHRGGGARGRLLWKGSAYRVGQGGRLAPDSPLDLSPRLGMGVRNSRKERGRGCLRGRGHSRRQRMVREEEEKADEEEGEEKREEGQRRGWLDKENRPHRWKGRAKEKETEEQEENGDGGRGQGRTEDDEEAGEDGSEATPEPVLLASDLSEELVNGTYLTVTLQRPSKAKQDPGTIVPKLEAAVGLRAPPSPPSRKGYLQRTSLQRPKLKSGVKSVEGGHALSSAHCHPEQRGVFCLDRKKEDCCLPSSASSSSSLTSPTPSFILSLPSLRDVGNEPGCEKEVWVSVFRYLTRTDLCLCMTVCKSWYKWSCDKRLWTQIDLSRCRSISPQALSGIIKRQPVSLELSWTSISKKQLTWLINRLPGLKDLMVSGCYWSSLSALSSPSCPLLRTLDLSWAEGVKDVQIRDLLTPPGCDNRSKLRNLQSFRLAGLEISDSTLRLIIRHMPLLARLDLAHCRGVTDQSINLLTAVGSSTRNTLTEINLSGCCKLTDTCLLYLRRVSSLSLLDLRDCKHITRPACESFISELSVNALYCLSEDKLIQRIS
ncbi:lysine-specific demethylase 2A isoform X2 [Conger conger]|uniref:lysine-specific demethylase 2A isoform X2 n=1 Tax=Conger conger TaxID=82655 RepID=UPI002A59A4A2|nr:lysine-specific demethylase 2A isoform X2 [Conger conger]